MTKRNPEFGGFSACFAVRTETDQKGKATPPARTETVYLTTRSLLIRFQPTPPARTETLLNRGADRTGISTHSAREDGDRNSKREAPGGTGHFNPLRPRGRRLRSRATEVVEKIFQPTPPARTETAILHKKTNNSSSHFHNQITSYSSNHRQPTLHTSKAVFTVQFFRCESPVNSCLLLVRTKLFETSLPPAARSEYQRLFHFNPFTHPNMVHLCSVFISQVVKSKAVSLLINDICQYGF